MSEVRSIRNRDAPFLEELKTLLTAQPFRYSDGTVGEFAEVQIGVQKRPAWYPFLSLHTSETDFGVQSSGQGAGMRARRKETDFVVEIRYECSDPEEGVSRLLDLKWLVIDLLAEKTTGQTYRFLNASKAESVVITPENPEENLSWGFTGQVLISGTAEYAF